MAPEGERVEMGWREGVGVVGDGSRREVIINPIIFTSLPPINNECVLNLPYNVNKGSVPGAVGSIPCMV